jgi:hypothetical protein
MLPLRSESKALLGKSLIEEVTGHRKVVRRHARNVPLAKRPVNTWNNSK